MVSQPHVLCCLANGCEEIEVVTILDLLRRANIQSVTASVESDGHTSLTAAQGFSLHCDEPLSKLADGDFQALILPGGQRASETFQHSVLLRETLNQFQCSNRLVAAIGTSPPLVLVKHQLYSEANITGFPALEMAIPAAQWQNKRVVWDPRFHLLTSQGPGTAIDFTLKMIELLAGKRRARQVAAPLVLASGIYDYQLDRLQN